MTKAIPYGRTKTKVKSTKVASHLRFVNLVILVPYGDAKRKVQSKWSRFTSLNFGGKLVLLAHHISFRKTQEHRHNWHDYVTFVRNGMYILLGADKDGET